MNEAIDLTSRSRWVAITSLMTALALVGNYLLVGIPNVELGTTILFITSFTFGIHMGMWVVLLMSLVYSFINPWGPFIPQIWITQVIGWLFVILAGFVLRRGGEKEFRDLKSRILLFIVGILVTLFFDLITTLGFSWATNVPLWLSLISVIPFTLIHIISNAFLFALVVPDLQHAISKELGSMIWQPSEYQIREE